MGSDEMFVYGDRSQVNFVELVQDVCSAYTCRCWRSTTVLDDVRRPPDARAKAVLESLARDVKLIGVPNLVLA